MFISLYYFYSYIFFPYVKEKWSKKGHGSLLPTRSYSDTECEYYTAVDLA